MKTTIDRAGRIVIPKDIRRQAHLEPGTEVEVRYRDGAVEIQPATRPMRFVWEGQMLVATVDGPYEPLTLEDIERIREEIRDERAGLA